MTVLGIDPGYGRTGYAVLRRQSASQIDLIDYGCIETDKRADATVRLAELAEAFRKLVAQRKPQLLAIEQLFFVKNVTTAIRVGEARGVILAEAGRKHLPVIECTPTEMKHALTGYGNATKRQIQKTVSALFRLKKPVTPDDAADAVAIAWTALAKHHLQKKIQ
jgi:crossover junction endodeoxyribonuclease RuvC